MRCPSCSGEFRSIPYEGVTIDHCEGCAGYWLDVGELEVILGQEKLKLSADIRDMILASLPAIPVTQDRPLCCPMCGETMRKHTIRDAGLTFDQCGRHGIWLDAGELQALEVFEGARDEMLRFLLSQLELDGDG